MENEMKYILEVKVTGWITKAIEADSLEQAEDIAAEMDWTMPLGDLRWKSVEVEAQEKGN